MHIDPRSPIWQLFTNNRKIVLAMHSYCYPMDLERVVIQMKRKHETTKHQTVKHDHQNWT